MRRPADYFVSQADEARVTRIWSGLDARLVRARRRRPWLQAGALALAAAALIVLAPRGWLARQRVPEQQTLRLADGSRVEHSAGDLVEIVAVTSERIELRMTQGRAHFEVTPNHARNFVTQAGDYTIRVVGTAYTVDLGPAALHVDVAHGEVEVRRNATGALWRVRGGEHWRSSDPPPTAAGAGSDKRAISPQPTAAELLAQLSAAEPQEPVVPARATETEAETASANAGRTPGVHSKHDRSTGEAAQLFQRALTARGAGELAECERLLSELLRRFPRDARAGLAAFQLGRVRLELGDARGALSALDRAARDLGTFEEQIEARRVQALELLGEHTACQTARDAFLRTYPHGSFTAVVRQRCP